MNSETFDEESRSEEDFANDIKKLREDMVNDAKLEMTKIKRESVVDQRAKQYSITQDEFKEMARDFGFNGNFKEVPNNFPLTHALPPEIKVAANKFRRSVEHIFKNKKQVTLRNQETGIIDVNDLYRVAMKDYNVFKEEGRKTTSNYVAFILQDGSGSMRGTKEVYSAHALSVIEEGLRDIIPFKTATFCSEDGGIRHYVVRGWSDKSKNNYSINFLKSRYANGGNDDDKSIMVAAKELMKRPEKDKILIVLSDGLPSSEENTKNAIKRARDMGIHVVGIMFGDESFRESNIDIYKKMYEKNIIATSPDKNGDR
jgi:cobalamin biosynthesis protein CobT